MPQLVNQFEFDRPITIHETHPFTITFTNIPVQSGNTVVLARRINYSQYTNYLADVSSTYEDISSKTSVSNNVVTVTDIFSSDSPTAGNYVIKVVLRDNTGTVSDEEANVRIRVLDA